MCGQVEIKDDANRQFHDSDYVRGSGNHFVQVIRGYIRHSAVLSSGDGNGGMNEPERGEAGWVNK